MGSPDPLSDNIIRSLRKILRKVNEHSRQLSREGDLSVTGLLCLRFIAAYHTPRTLTSVEIARGIQLTTPTISRILERLERNGLISRTRSPNDRRKLFVKLTAKGKRRLANLPPPLQEGFLERLAKQPQKKQRQILEVLEEVVDLMDAQELDAAPILSPEVVDKRTGEK